MGPSILYQLEGSISIFRGVWCTFFITFDRNSCKQTVETLIICRVLRRLIWVCTVCLCPKNGTLGYYWLLYLFKFSPSVWGCNVSENRDNGEVLDLKYQYKDFNFITVMIISFRTDMPGQTVQTQIRLLLEEQSDQGLHCLPFCLHRLNSLLYGRAT